MLKDSVEKEWTCFLILYNLSVILRTLIFVQPKQYLKEMKFCTFLAGQLNEN